MPSFFSAAALVASASLAMAIPTELSTRTGGFSIQQLDTGNKVFKSGPLAMAKTYAKYNKPAPDHVQAAAAAAAVQSGTVSANPTQYDSEYLCPVTVGSNTLNLDFDTGSSDLWVFSTKTPSNERGSHALYNPSNSGTLKSGYTWNIGYGDGSGASGTVYADKVKVGAVTATSQAVEIATSASASFVQGQGDGLLGLAFSSINTVKPQKQTTFFDTVKSSLPKQLFTATLKAGKAGSYDFGYLDSSKYSGSISYVSVNSGNGFWEFNAGAGGAGRASGSSIGDSIADTGTTLLYLPENTVDSFYSNMQSAQYDQNQGGYVFDCGETPPNFVVTIGSGTYTIPGSYINYAPTDNSGETCFGGIQYNTDIGMSIFGDIFLKAMYVVFDTTQSSPRLGFAQQR